MTINTQAFGNSQAHSENNQRDNGSVTHRNDSTISEPELRKFIEGANFPANKLQLVEHAKAQQAPSHILNVLEQLPTPEFGSENDRKLTQYNSVDELLQEIGKLEQFGRMHSS
jgi:hypothetical protein